MVGKPRFFVSTRASNAGLHLLSLSTVYHQVIAKQVVAEFRNIDGMLSRKALKE